MSEPFLGELKCVSFNFAPKGWAMANGQLMPIQQNQALFSVLGTTFGGDGRQTFALPNIQGRVPVGIGNGVVLGELGGEINHTLSINEIPSHNHIVNVATSFDSAQTSPASNFLAGGGSVAVYNSVLNPVGMNTAMISTVGGNQAHSNQQPYLVLTWVIALQGIFPSPN